MTTSKKYLDTLSICLLFLIAACLPAALHKLSDIILPITTALAVLLLILYISKISNNRREGIAFSILLSYYLVGFYLASIIPQISDIPHGAIRSSLALIKNIGACAALSIVTLSALRKGVKPNTWTLMFCVCVGIATLLPVQNNQVKLQYLANSFIPIALLITFISLKSQAPDLPSYSNTNIRPWAVLLLLSAPIGALISLVLIPPEYFLEQQSAKGYELISGYPRPWWTNIGDNLYLRFPGTSEDPILFGYITAAVSLALISEKKKALAILTILLTFISMSKGAIIWLIGSLILSVLSEKLKQKRLVYFASSSAIIALYLQGASNLKTSASVHLVGLLSPIQNALSSPGIESMLGHGIGSSGNILKSYLMGDLSHDDWLSGGAESGLGLVIYQSGLLGGITLALATFSAFKKLKSPLSKSAWAIYWINALMQENLVNLNYLICLFVVIYAAEQAYINSKLNLKRKTL